MRHADISLWFKWNGLQCQVCAAMGSCRRVSQTVPYCFSHISIASYRDFEAGREEEELFTESDRDSVGLSELPGQEESKINTTIEVDSRDARESRRRVEHAPLKHFNATKNDV